MNDDLLIKLGQRIRELRKNKNLSIEDLSLICNINRNYLGDLERGKRNPTVKVLFKISNGLSIKIKDLFKGYKFFL